MPEALLAAGLAKRLSASHRGRLPPPEFDPIRDSETGILNPRGLSDHARHLADSIGRVLDEDEFPIVLGGDCSILLGCSLALRRRRPDDGKLELGVVTADGVVQWLRTMARTAVGNTDASPYTRSTEARSVRIKLDRKVMYELDGGDRTRVKALKVEIEPGAIEVCVP